jgi:L-asparagine transporter-like permease
MIEQQIAKVTNREHGLKQHLTAGQMAMVAVGGSVGTGLLLGSGAAIQVAGPAAIVSYIIAALICWTVALALGEMSSVHPAAGSFGVYAELYLNDWAGFVARYGYWLSAIMAIGSEVVAAGTYMQVWYPKVPVVTWMMVFGLLLLLVNLFPVGNYGTFEYWFAFIKVITIFLFIVIGAALLIGTRIHPQYVANGGFAPNGWRAAFITASFALYSFLGIEMVAISSGEARSGAEVSKATSISFALLVCLYVGAMAVLVGVMPWRDAGVAQSPFVRVFNFAGIPSAATIMNLVVLSAALSAANALLYVTSRTLFSLARSGHAPRRLGALNSQGVPIRAVVASMAGIVIAIFVQKFAPEKAYLYIIGAALFGGMLAWLISLAAHVRFRKVITREQLAVLKLRAPLGAAGSILGFVAITAAVMATWWVPQFRITVVSAAPCLLVLSVAYWLVRKRA